MTRNVRDALWPRLDSTMNQTRNESACQVGDMITVVNAQPLIQRTTGEGYFVRRPDNRKRETHVSKGYSGHGGEWKLMESFFKDLKL